MDRCVKDVCDSNTEVLSNTTLKAISSLLGPPHTPRPVISGAAITPTPYNIDMYGGKAMRLLFKK
jgi:hypothetical protein